MAHLAVAAGQPLETVLMWWPRSPASISSYFGVIGERQPRNLANGCVTSLFRRAAAAVLPALRIISCIILRPKRHI
jgi:hypothetical protein